MAVFLFRFLIAHVSLAPFVKKPQRMIPTSRNSLNLPLVLDEGRRQVLGSRDLSCSHARPLGALNGEGNRNRISPAFVLSMMLLLSLFGKPEIGA